MKNYKAANRRKSSQKASVIVAVMLCAVSMLGIAMVYKNAVKKQQNVKSLIETEDGSEAQAEDSDDETHTHVSLNAATEEEKELDEADIKEAGVVDSSRKDLNEEVYVENIDLTYTENHFNADSYLTWPVQGEVLMEYSMDSPTYFKTLEQYGYSTGMLIQAERGTPVYASADGVVKSVSYTDEYGWTLTMDLGDGYEATYGQLADIRVSEGDAIVTGSLIAEVAVPSKFYSLEGDNLYFSMRQDEDYVDPLDYLE